MPNAKTRNGPRPRSAWSARCSGSVSPTVGTPSVRNTTTPSAPSAGGAASASESAPATLVPPPASRRRTQACAPCAVSLETAVHPVAYRSTPLENAITRNRSPARTVRSEEHTSELQSHVNLVCRLLLEKKKKKIKSLFHFKTKKNKKTK